MIRLSALLLVVACTLIKSAAGEFALKHGDRVLFLGDSITFADKYIQYLDAYLFTRFPDKSFELINRGMPSETVAGTSEPTHIPPRPNLHTRLSEALSSLNADVVFACYGMNDGIYLPPNEEVFARYRSGINRLVESVRQTTARFNLMTPPPFDPRPFAGKPETTPADYRRPASNYDDTLKQFSRWLLAQYSNDFTVIDLHQPLTNFLETARKRLPDFALSPDGIHPTSTGHLLIAAQILQALNAPREISSAALSFTSNTHAHEHITNFQQTARGLSFDWEIPLPCPSDPTWESTITGEWDILAKFNSFPLKVADLPEGRYNVTFLGEDLAFTSNELALGVDLGPIYRRAVEDGTQKVWRRIEQRRQLLLEVWVRDDPHPRLQGMHKNSKASREQIADLTTQIHALCKPKPVRFTITRK